MSKTYEDLVKECNALIPRDVIESRDGGQGRKLSYLPGFYVINRLNEVFGQGNWAYTSEVQNVHSGVIQDRYGKDIHSTHYIAKVRLVVTLGQLPTEFSDYGYGDGTDKTNPGKAHELAVKEAVTDGLKRCARCLGNSFGNGLYDKSGEGIDEGQKEVPKGNTQPIAPNPVAGVPAEPKAAVPGASRETVNKLISATAKVAVDKNRLTKDQALAMIKEHGAEKKEDLTDAQAQDVLNKLKEAIKE